MKRVCIIGGGAAGMMAAVFAAKNGARVELFEKNEKLGKKIYITGKGRCNLTNNCEVEELLQNVCTNAKFLYSGFYSFTAQDVMAFFEEAGTPLKTERGNRVFPASDHAYDVTAALERMMKQYGVQVHLRTTVEALLTREKDGEIQACGLGLADGKEVPADAVIVATGGFSYQSTGSTGDGYRFAEEAGHTVTERIPALVPMNAKEAWVKELQGLSLRNVNMTVYQEKKKQYDAFGEMLFTHFGVSGPLVLTASSFVGARLKRQPLRMVIDLKPALSKEQLDARVLRDFEAAPNKNFKNAVSGLFPAKLQPVMLDLSGIDPEKKVNLISREERREFVDLMKNLELTVTGLRDYNEAIITKGGVSVREVNPSTMESKKLPGLYFAGEVLDLDAVTGGFNLQIAWSTGYLAGCAAAEG
ncbi:MAG: NAD(P)/FAD-dependent oxidoreductase [Lachnospiraceae bacterium]|nr:NAD(P)/FAD-dependent oxidoreductase [Lachnospiraceae bacterium]